MPRQLQNSCQFENSEDLDGTMVILVVVMVIIVAIMDGGDQCGHHVFHCCHDGDHCYFSFQ